MALYQSAERISHTNIVDNVNFQRHLFAYAKAANMISGTVIEIGCGDGYGIKLLIDHCDHYVAIDKNKNPLIEQYTGIDFFKIVLPRLQTMPSNIFDYAVSFQVIEHIKDDALFLKELRRILKPGGKLLLTTPNALRSVSKNPWHVREYTPSQIEKKIKAVFTQTTISGIYGSNKVEEYLALNKIHVEAIQRYDFLNLRSHLPRWMLKIPYDILNHFQKNRIRQLKGADDIDHSDFYIDDLHKNCIDYFVKAVK